MSDADLPDEALAIIEVIAGAIRDELGEEIDAYPAHREPEQADPLNWAFRAVVRAVLATDFAPRASPTVAVSRALRRVAERRLAASAGKKLLDVKHPAFRAVTAIRGKIGSYWKRLPLPHPEPGVRLIRQDKVEEFAAQMADFKVELDDAVRGVAAQDLRDSQALRQQVAAQLARVQTSLDAMLVERPRRRILRQVATPGEA